ncbi:mechanosensitive ion channel protein MscS [Bacillus pseudomycoides]|uniref:Mechanosensitive ion channel protein MscS n=1 Tax=Bacillus pseudomycoides TaxID=64104 RepID=A0AA91ZU79_9BACI|nr:MULTISPECIES: mechanosensitive ion channel family protein [Bacillus]PEB57001.1 mechanosensitive ion channel protein MscS [Bacillus sp. AFS098217]PED83379.1 mechanosensitive ion channel protein MscS [Bacillus pseudomycoides]PEU14921.1 mechanosensitive ion channel protein MscS [Bacillus sp. AFS014408]PEU15365.1 mechanosensitive ion channel protein MscS [Bacillus sp. AFS019443]PFW61109.1 mechanosensitive ion channel protein MscS [Bacillus sp. AFS075034]
MDLLIQWFDSINWANVGMRTIKIIVILVLGVIVVRLARAIVRKAFHMGSRSPIQISERRTVTVAKLLENIVAYVVMFIMLIAILGVFDINASGLLAGAGVIGLAVGFGAQSLVKDVITGLFILLEDQFSVGDYVRIGQFEGAVLEIGLRTTKIKSWTGEIHILPNGSITQVTNFSISNSVAFVDVSISYESDINRAEQVIEKLLQELPEKYEEMVTTPQLLGVQTLAASEVVLRVISEVEPMKQAVIARALRKEIKARLDLHGIEIPYPRMVLYNREELISEKAN